MASITGAGIALAGLIIGYLQIAALVVFLAMALAGGFLAASNLENTFGSGQEDSARNWVNGTGKTYVELYFLKARSYPDSLDELMESPRSGSTPVVKQASDLEDLGAIRTNTDILARRTPTLLICGQSRPTAGQSEIGTKLPLKAPISQSLRLFEYHVHF